MIYLKDGVKKMRPVLTEAEYRQLRGTKKQKFLVDATRQGDAKAKMRLLQMNYSCLPNEGDTLKGATQPSNSVGMDIDHLSQAQMSEVKERILARKDDLGLLMLELSARGEGYHLVFRRRADLAQEDNLRWASELLGVQYDEGAKDITRVFFTTTDEEEDLLFVDKEIFEQTLPLTPPQGRGVRCDAAPKTMRQENEIIAKSEVTTPLPCGGVGGGSYDGICYSAIVSALADQLGGIPAHGSRNQFIFAMACHLRYVCNDDPEWIAQVLPTYGESEERWKSTIQSACRRSQNKAMPKVLLRAIDQARILTEETVQMEGKEGAAEEDALLNPPPMPEKLPSLIELLISKTPKIYQPAVAHAVFPALAAHLWKTRFRYIDNVEHEATLMNVLMAGSGAGKNCIAAPIDCIMRDIRQKDALSLEKERAWKEEMNTKGANKDKKKRPEGIIIQEVDADMTNAAFVLRLAEADEHFLYVRMNEIDQFDALKTSAKSKSQFQIMCLAFDPGNSYGQTRVGASSVSARVCIRFNWNASTTVLKGQSYFKSVLTDGPISRINFCTIPEQPIGAPLPIYGKYDLQFESMLRPYIDHLNAARGLVECPQAEALAYALMEENARFAELSSSRTYENLSYRANVIAYLKAMVLYVAQGMQWDETIEDFIRWSEQYDLWCKMHFFGDAIDEASGYHAHNAKRRGPRNLLELLPASFSFEDAISVRRKNNLPAENTNTMLSNWENRGYIRRESEGWRKL